MTANATADGSGTTTSTISLPLRLSENDVPGRTTESDCPSESVPTVPSVKIPALDAAPVTSNTVHE